MSTRNEKRLISLANRRKRLVDRIIRNAKEHKATQALYGRLVEATTKQIQTELRLERRRA